MLFGLGIQGKPAHEVEDFVRDAHKSEKGLASNTFSRLYLNFIATLTVSRLVLLSDIESLSLWTLVTFLHVFEAFWFWMEALRSGMKPTPILVIIALNGVLFSAYTASLAGLF